MIQNKTSFHIFLVTAAVFLAYASTLFNGFAWDDVVVILNNHAITGSPAALFSGIDTAKDSDITPYYRPLTLLSFHIEQLLHGLTPSLMHGINLLLHCCNSILLYFLARNVSANQTTALFASLLFAVHPLNTEGVAFLSGGRNTLLATAFCLSAYLMYQKSEDTTSYRLPISAVLLLAALLSKETALALIPVIGANEIRTVRGAGAHSVWTSVRRISWYFLPLALYFWLRTQALDKAGYSYDVFSGLLSRLSNNFFIIPRYLLTIIWPPFSSIHYTLPDNLHSFALPLAAAWVGIIAFLWWILRRNQDNAVKFGLTWLFVFWLPTSGIIPFPSAPMADRYLYLPVIGLWIIIAHLLNDWCCRTPRASRYTLTALFMLFTALTASTIHRSGIWKNDLTLFADFVQHFPEQAFGHHNLGTAYLDLEKAPDKAEREFGIVLTIDPAFPRLHTQLGYIRLLRGDLAGALAQYDEALTLDPHDAEALLNRGNILLQIGETRQAVRDYERFLFAPDREFDAIRPNIRQRISELQNTSGKTGTNPP